MPTVTIYADASDRDIISENSVWSTARNGAGLVLNSLTASEPLFGTLYTGTSYSAFEYFVRYNLSSIPSGSTCNSVIDQVVAGFSSGIGNSFTLWHRQNDWPASAVATSFWLSGSTQVGVTTFLSSRPLGSWSGGTMYNLSDSGNLVSSVQSRFGGNFDTFFCSDRMTSLSGPTGNEYATIRSGDTGTTTAPRLSITYTAPNNAPTFLASPSVAYQVVDSITSQATGPRAYVQISLIPGDAEGTNISVRLERSSDGLVMSGPVTVASGASCVFTIPYNISGLSEGDNTCRVRLTDTVNGSLQTVSGNFTVKRDSTLPFLSGTITTSPASVTSATQSYQVVFTPRDAQATGSSQLRYQVHRNSDAGSGPATANVFLGGSNGTACTNNVQVTTPSVTTDTLINGANQRYVRFRDFAGNWAEFPFTITAVLNTPVAMSLTTAAGQSGTAAGANQVTLGAPEVFLAGSIQTAAATSSTSLALSTPQRLPLVADGTAATSLLLSVPGRLAALQPTATSSTVLAVSTSVPVLATAAISTSSADLALVLPYQLSPTPAGVASTALSLDATPGPRPIFPAADGVSSAAVSLATTPVVAFLTLNTAVGASTGESTLAATPAIAFILGLLADGASTGQGNLGDTPGYRVELDQVTSSSAASLTLIIGFLLSLNPSEASSAASLTPSAAFARSELLPLEFQGEFQVDQQLPIEAAASPSVSRQVEFEWLVSHGQARSAPLEWGRILGPLAPAPLEWRAQTAVDGESGLETLIQVTCTMQAPIEVLVGLADDEEMAIGVPGWVITQAQAPIGSKVAVVSQPIGYPLESLVISTVVTAEAPYEHQEGVPSDAVAPVESSWTTERSAESSLEWTVPVTASAQAPFSSYVGLRANAAIPVEAKGWELSIGPNAEADLVVQRGPVAETLLIHRVQSKDKIRVFIP